MSRYRAYGEYKDSGIEWLGGIPNHWGLTRIKYVAELTPRKPNIDRNLECSFIPMEKLKTNSVILDETRLINDVYDGYTCFQDGDILMAKVTPCFENKNIAIAVGLLNKIGFGSSEIYVIRANEPATNRYWYYRLQEDTFMDIATAAMTGAGGLRRVPSDVVSNFVAAFPNPDEQQTIANFLDHETAKIDTLIAKQQQLIKLLKEKRQAVISHAVTKGLNPNAPMRDSGVEWLGEVPEHWVVSRLKFNCKVKGRIGFRGYTVDDLVDRDSGALVIGASEMTINGDLMMDSCPSISWKKYYESPEIMLKGGMILFVQRGSTVGKVAYVPDDLGLATINPSLILLRDLTLRSQFLKYCLMSSSIQTLVKIQTSTTAIPMISQEQVGNYWQCIPPCAEQEKIENHIETQIGAIGIAINTCFRSIELSQERRTALISAAVTGKIDVRDWQPPVEKTQELAL